MCLTHRCTGIQDTVGTHGYLVPLSDCLYTFRKCIPKGLLICFHTSGLGLGMAFSLISLPFLSSFSSSNVPPFLSHSLSSLSPLPHPMLPPPPPQPPLLPTLLFLVFPPSHPRLRLVLLVQERLHRLMLHPQHPLLGFQQIVSNV